MAFAFMVGCATVVLVTAIYNNTPISASAGKDYQFSLGHQQSCHENVSDNFDK